jgi:hypothetical protein
MKFGHLSETDNATGKCRSPKQLMGAGKIKFEHLGKTKDLAATSTEASGSGGGLIPLFSHFLIKKNACACALEPWPSVLEDSALRVVVLPVEPVVL